ncbi:MAG TPA: hypothetical protein VLU95_00090 [Candidatus Acidoferrum sp.]|nr:hypothetical protein [Candidatus Acidoferrum sp.]
MTNASITCGSQVLDPSWKSICKVGAVAALVAALVFRRNLGVAEIPLLTGIVPPWQRGGLVHFASWQSTFRVDVA